MRRMFGNIYYQGYFPISLTHQTDVMFYSVYAGFPLHTPLPGSSMNFNIYPNHRSLPSTPLLGFSVFRSPIDVICTDTSRPPASIQFPSRQIHGSFVTASTYYTTHETL